MTRKNQLRRSGTRLQQQGALWLQQTRNAGGTFVTEAQDASVTFGQDMKAASAKLVRTAGRSAQGFQKALNKEARDWQAVVLQTRDGYMAAAEERRERVERQAVSAREALKPGAVETTVLQSAHGLLELAQSRVDARLEQGAKTASKPTAVKVGAKKGQSPMRNYDQLTAKDLVTRVQKLSAPQATAVLDYERGRKKRATVIRAAEQRLAAAS
ncbi:MAG: hypothetical protein JRD92_01500 [Deltaproteobacteria bacterium]|nr:hypothetical protein [Deltaproteobacteria bacterium]MBW2374591.1 hypothetical protein [Deltaproteobacteria bacterium]MBW2585604.1 hypothetical protein [Deltaproteobacteria bacterium]